MLTRPTGPLRKLNQNRWRIQHLHYKHHVRSLSWAVCGALYPIEWFYLVGFGDFAYKSSCCTGLLQGVFSRQILGTLIFWLPCRRQLLQHEMPPKKRRTHQGPPGPCPPHLQFVFGELCIFFLFLKICLTTLLNSQGLAIPEVFCRKKMALSHLWIAVDSNIPVIVSDKAIRRYRVHPSCLLHANSAARADLVFMQKLHLGFR